MAKKSKDATPKNKMNTFVFLLVCVLILGGFFAFISMQAASYNSLRAEYNRLQAEIDREHVINENLRYQMAHFDSDAYIEELARERLGWVRPNEIVFRQMVDEFR